ncbi:hypothetical protein [Microbacterium candidum]|uniref:XRE family transcriptional regulator n=1 Tax=Microbacterium candidum TaxID=3041922 RepID=A0ABT7N3C3_9MICO|nr:hypothetical protein [Microbacterium sp. ASV49]MDL9981205.1 hypothetical protein [Microbacterium sp. ASV49]
MDAVTFADLIAAPPIPRVELAQRAGVSRNTEWVLRQDQSRARLDTLREIALACGFDIEIRLDRAYQPAAAAAARDLLDDLTDMDPPLLRADLGAWRDRLLRYVRADDGDEGSVDPLRLVSEAAALSAPQNSPDAIMLAGRNDLERLMSAASATSTEYRDHRYVFSGGAALRALRVELPHDLTTIASAESEQERWAKMPTVVWTSLPTQFSRYLMETHRSVRTARAATVIIAPLAPHHLVRAAEPGGVPLVSPIQAVIDSLGVGGDLGLTALDLARSW